MLSETWLLPSIHASELFGNSFSVFRRDRHSSGTRKGGGVLIAAKSNLGSDFLDIPNTSNAEFVACRVLSCERNFYLYCGYMPPDSSIDTYYAHLRAIETLCKLARFNDIVLVAADFNLPNLNWVSSDISSNTLLPMNVRSEVETIVTDGLAGVGLNQLNDIANSRNKLLDLIYCSCADDINICRSPFPLKHENIHHNALEVHIDCVSDSSTVSFDCQTYNFAMADLSTLNNFFNTLNWESIFRSCTDVNQKVLRFYCALFTGFELSIPKSTNRPRRDKHPPWYNPPLIRLKNQKNNAYKTYRKYGSIGNYNKYVELRRNFVNMQNLLHERYLNRIQKNLKHDPRSFFSYVNSKRKSSGYPANMIFKDQASSDVLIICNLFADFFEEVYVDLNVDSAQSSPPASNSNINLGSIELTSVNVMEGLLNIDASKGPGPDDIPPSILRNCASTICQPLLHIFNTSLSLGIFPDFWKTSHIVPIFKSGSRKNISNYRGISILPTIAKLFESILTDILTPLLEPCISASQHGFRKGRSTCTNLVEFTNFALRAIESGKQVDVIYTDFSKAFDRVQHSILLRKLENIGIHSSLLAWIKSYLTGRSQYVKLGDNRSRTFGVKSGVPQGSHLGPLLFLLFIDDIRATFVKCQCLMYADDLKIYTVISSFSDVAELQHDLDRLSDWCATNMLSLNINKCCSVSYHRQRNPIFNDYRINDQVLNRKLEMNDLGVIFDTKISFIAHIDYITAKAFSMLGFVMRAGEELSDPYALKTVYCSLVRSILEYCCTVWNPYYDVHINRIESIQRKFVRYALRRLPWTDTTNLPPYTSRCRLIDLEPLEYRRSDFSVLLIFDLLTGRINSGKLLSMISLNVPHVRRLRAHDFLSTAYHRTNYGMSEPLNRACKAFNMSSQYFDFGQSRDTFRNKIKGARIRW
jgi:hypothetical protein